MDAVFIKVLNMSWAAMWMILAVMLFRLLFKKAPKAIVCCLWGLVALRLLIPFSFESALSLIPSSEPISENIFFDATPSIESGIDSIDAPVNSILAEHYTPDQFASVNPLQIALFVLECIWIGGIILFLIYALISFIVLKYKVRASIAYDKHVKMCDSVSSPFILGIFCPTVYLPSEIGEEQIEHVLLHERSHIKRKDHWWKPLGFLILTVYWFNPLIWLAYWMLCRDIEFACDERVIKNMDRSGIKDYSQTLLDCSVSRRSIVMCPLAFGEVGVKQRIKSVLSFKKPAVWVIIVAILVSVVLCITLLTGPKTEGRDYDLWVLEGKAGDITAFNHTDQNSLFFYGISEVKVMIDGAYIDLKDALERDEFLIQKLIERAKSVGKIEKDEDSGTTLYRCDEYAILDLDLKVTYLGVENDLGNQKYSYDGGIYFGTEEMTIDEIESLWANRKIPASNLDAISINLDGNSSIVYGGKDVSGSDAAEVIKEYYKTLKYSKTHYDEFYTDVLKNKNKNAVKQDVDLLSFNHCNVVNSMMLKSSDYERFNELSGDYYACCYVQTADKILCNEDGAFGNKGEEVNRCFSYFLVRESEKSEWKIYDFGYPSFYNPGTITNEYELRVKQSNDFSLNKVTDGDLKDKYGYDIYYCGLERVEVYYKGKYVVLTDVLDNVNIINGILDLAKDGVEGGNGDYYKDGGSMVYFGNDYTIIKMHALTADSNKFDETLYIGPAQMKISDIKKYS